MGQSKYARNNEDAGKIGVFAGICGSGRDRTCIKGFGNPYTIHCTTEPVVDGKNTVSRRDKQTGF